MPIRVDAPSRFSAIQANDKPVYLNLEGAIKTRGGLKDRLVGIAESLGIFKTYVTSYREHEAAHNRAAYAVAWEFVSNRYGMTVRHHTQQVMKEEGYALVNYYAERLRGRDASDPQRAIVGREVRLILDAALGVNEALWGDDVTLQQYEGTMVQSSEQELAQKQLWEGWTGSVQGGEEVTSPSGTDAMETVAEAAETRDGEIAEASALESQTDEVGNKPAQVPRELGRAMVAGNKERLHQILGGETQLRVLAQELGYDPENIVPRQSYILSKLEQRLEADPRAKSGKLTSNEIRELARSVFDKALGKSTMVAGIRGVMLGASSKVKRALTEDNSDQVDVLELSKDKIKAATRDRTYLKKLMVDRLGSQDQDIDPARVAHIEHLAINEATARVREAKVELSYAEVDDVLVHSLRRSLEVGQYKAWLKGRLGKVSRAVNPELHGLKRSAEDVLEKAADENPRVLVEAADQRHDSPEAAAVAAPSPASLPQVSLPKPQRYKGVDYFDQSDKAITRLGIPVRNHQAAKQVVSDDRYLATSVPEGHSEDELTPAHRKYIETTLLRHVAEHERTKPDTPLGAGDLHLMMMPITARALGMQSSKVLGAKVLYKNVTKHIGHKDAAFGHGLKKLRRDARSKANSKANLLSFVREVARKTNITIEINHSVLKTIRPQVKDMAEAYVDEHRKVLTDADLEGIVQVALNGYRLAAVHSPMRDFRW